MFVLPSGAFTIIGGEYRSGFAGVDNPGDPALVTVEIGSVPASLKLGQSSPNPFTVGTTMSFEIPTESFVSLKAYNVLGEEVATLVNGPLNAGRHEVTWNVRQTIHGRSSELPSGVYFLRLRSGGFARTRRLVLVR